MSNHKDLVGQRFNRFVVISFDKIHRYPSGQRSPRWNCECDCGAIKSVIERSLKSGGVKSCGCLKLEKLTKSGMSRTRQHQTWSDMKQRCNNPNTINYEIYGKRGITYDPKWETFEGFWEDMEEGYSDNLTLERLDSDGNYCKSNCTWSTPDKQVRNRRKQANNTSGKTGVVLHKRRGEKIAWVAKWHDTEGKGRGKSYSLSKYGEEEAFRLACEYRDEQIRLLNEQGAGYTEGHGK